LPAREENVLSKASIMFVMHYIADSMIVLSLNKLPSIQPGEISWILHYGPTMNTFSSMLMLVFIILIPVLFISNYLRIRKQVQAGSIVAEL
jgi:hypothetical protein